MTTISFFEILNKEGDMLTESRKPLRQFLIALVIALIAGLPSTLLAQQAADPIQEDKLELGKRVYFKRCVWCHGVEGGGDGPSADRLFTRPRNFIQGTFKIRWTDSGELPLDRNLEDTVRNGLPGSAMPAWGSGVMGGSVLSEEEIKAVVQFVKSLVQDRDFSDEDEEVFVQDFGSNPWGTQGPYHLGIPQEDIDQGKEIFLKNKCFECHGGEGRGDGNPTMKDDWGFPIVAADWTQCWNFRGSRRKHYDPFNVVRTVSTGLNGTPMPNFKDQITLEDRWKLAAFVNSLCPRKKIDKNANKPVNDSLITSKFVAGPVSTDLKDPMWQAPEDDPLIKPRPSDYTGNQKWHYIAMAGQITRGDRNFKPKVDNLWVMSNWSEEEQAAYYLVEFHNRFLSVNPDYPDGVAMQWPGQLEDLFGAEKPYFIYGDSKKPTDIWKANFMVQNYKDTNAPNPDGYTLDVNVQELIGKGFEDVNEKETPGGVEVVNSIYHQGRVKILFKRSLKTENPNRTDVQIPIQTYIPVSFMQWSGWDKEHDEHMAISTWVYTILEPPLPKSLVYMPPIMAVGWFGFQMWLVWMTKRTRKMHEEGKAE
ncbi:MAG: c-type cytochrome [Nitrospinaceae bacterium]|nr:c-type cytochrome [Nitrospinaceae bacterium]NIR56508.1 c-type cytochrome [Nitrospinaceae bacterium]NIS86966.1 c-type cytochrome [Nitrospinaceae bacterium]NIT83810.1 c-type cytochrome [Nitrospinaceae bacterium]NIU46016.1 c-type cytochrome [Nitrospinaceae bacterium]